MSEFQDHFSTYADQYARARPGYPPELFTYLTGLVPNHRLAWDCGTGNGQAASGLMPHFDRVVATDASEAQISRATSHPKIEYRVALAEDAAFQPHSVDLITVAQALHWFRFDAFYENVRRAAAPGAVLAAWCYTLPRVTSEIDAVVDHFYRDVTGPYWPPDRRYIDEKYATIPFPFAEIRPTPSFFCRNDWSLAEFTAYLTTWSAVQRFRQARGRDPLDEVAADLLAAWDRPDQRRSVGWPIHLRAGKVAIDE